LRENLTAFRDVLAEIEKLQQFDLTDIHPLWLRAAGKRTMSCLLDVNR
jgi:hypothetical protein